MIILGKIIWLCSLIAILNTFGIGIFPKEGETFENVSKTRNFILIGSSLIYWIGLINLAIQCIIKFFTV